MGFLKRNISKIFSAFSGKSFPALLLSSLFFFFPNVAKASASLETNRPTPVAEQFSRAKKETTPKKTGKTKATARKKKRAVYKNQPTGRPYKRKAPTKKSSATTSRPEKKHLQAIIEKAYKELVAMREEDEKRLSAQFHDATPVALEKAPPNTITETPADQRRQHPLADLLAPRPAQNTWGKSAHKTEALSSANYLAEFKTPFDPSRFLSDFNALPGGARMIKGGRFGSTRDKGNRIHIGNDVAMRQGSAFFPLHSGKVSERHISGIGFFPVVTYSDYFYTEYLHTRTKADLKSSFVTSDEILGHVAPKDRKSTGPHVHVQGFLVVSGKRKVLNLALMDWIGFRRAEKALGRLLTAHEILVFYEKGRAYDEASRKRLMSTLVYGAQTLVMSAERNQTIHEILGLAGNNYAPKRGDIFVKRVSRKLLAKQAEQAHRDRFALARLP